MRSYTLYFDGKHIEESEYYIVVLKNERTVVKLGALCLKDGTAKTIAVGIAKVHDEYNLWNSIKMINADTTSVKTEKKKGVVLQLHRMFSEKGINKLQFISCQHNVLDKILCVMMDEELAGSTKLLNI